MKNRGSILFVAFLSSAIGACNAAPKNSGAVKPSGNSSAGAADSNSSNQARTTAPTDLLAIPAGNSFVVSCSKKIKIPTSNNPLDVKSEAGMNAAIVFAELSQKGGVKICSEYWANTNDGEKAFLIEDKTADCKIKDVISEAELSLKVSCPPPQTGSQSLSKSSEKIYYRSTVYISGATAEQLKKLSAGWSELNLSTAGAENKNTDDLR